MMPQEFMLSKDMDVTVETSLHGAEAAVMARPRTSKDLSKLNRSRLDLDLSRAT